MVKVKDLATIQANYTNSAGTAASRYAAAAPNIVWEAPAAAGQALYVQAMQDPATLDRRAKGIAKVSDAAFRAAVTAKGAPVIASRMTAAASKQAQNYAPYKAALESVTLPAKTIDPVQNVNNRLIPIVQALVNTKKAQG